MKTLTEFSGTLIRMAAKAVAEARKQLPKDALRMRVPPPSPETHADVEPHDNKNESLPEEGLDSATDAAAWTKTVQDEARDVAAPVKVALSAKK